MSRKVRRHKFTEFQAFGRGFLGCSALSRFVVSEVPVFFPDCQVVDACESFFHQTIIVKFPVFVAIGAVPLACAILKFVFEADCNPVAGEGPEFFFEFVVQFFLPFAGEEGHDLLSSVEKFGAVAPFGIGGIGQ
jgi:hypothetical protein